MIDCRSTLRVENVSEALEFSHKTFANTFGRRFFGRGKPTAMVLRLPLHAIDVERRATILQHQWQAGPFRPPMRSAAQRSRQRRGYVKCPLVDADFHQDTAVFHADRNEQRTDVSESRFGQHAGLLRQWST
ncbi:hypothetical protein Pla52n_34490 [Stieleria varia]|uniref:Uncharacterized protein n=1 Tax=Stieleria varia TaxID=2528005 RepID=A0A5C6ASY6_9BACT|nr:hypothetical protein Pla52n_34490 [Stieleria varia]